MKIKAYANVNRIDKKVEDVITIPDETIPKGMEAKTKFLENTVINWMLNEKKCWGMFGWGWEEL